MAKDKDSEDTKSQDEATEKQFEQDIKNLEKTFPRNNNSDPDISDSDEEEKPAPTPPGSPNRKPQEQTGENRESSRSDSSEGYTTDEETSYNEQGYPKTPSNTSSSDEENSSEDGSQQSQATSEQKELEEKAATTIQSLARKKSAKTQLKNLKKEKIAIKIQSISRGHEVRSAAKAEKAWDKSIDDESKKFDEKIRKPEAAEEKVATTIQSLARKKSAQTQLKDLKEKKTVEVKAEKAEKAKLHNTRLEAEKAITPRVTTSSVNTPASAKNNNTNNTPTLAKKRIDVYETLETNYLEAEKKIIKDLLQQSSAKDLKNKIGENDASEFKRRVQDLANFNKDSFIDYHDRGKAFHHKLSKLDKWVKEKKESRLIQYKNALSLWGKQESNSDNTNNQSDQVENLSWLQRAQATWASISETVRHNIEILRNTFNTYGKTINELDKTIEGAKKSIREIAGSNPQTSNQNTLKDPLIDAVKSNSIDKIAELLMPPTNATNNPPNNSYNNQDENGMTALMHAASKKEPTYTNLLIGKANLAVQDNQGKTALMHAAINGNKTIIETLVTAGSTTSARDIDGKTALTYAAINGDTIIIDTLLKDKKVDIEEKDINGNSPLMHAVRKGNLDAIDFLLSKNADIDAKNHEGITPLMRAASGRKEAMYLLIEQGATVDEKTIEIAAKTFGKDHQIVNYTKAINKEQTAEQSFLDALNKIKDNTTLKEEIGSDDARKLRTDIDTMISSYREQKPREEKLNNLKQNMKDLESWVSTRTNYSMDILMDDIQEMFSTCLPTNVNEDLSKSHKRANIKNYHDTISTQSKTLGTHTTRVISGRATAKKRNNQRTP